MLIFILYQILRTVQCFLLTLCTDVFGINLMVITLNNIFDIMSISAGDPFWGYFWAYFYAPLFLSAPQYFIMKLCRVVL